MKLLFIAFLFLAYTNINVVEGKCKGWKLRMLEWIGCDGPDDTKPLCKIFGFCEDETVTTPVPIVDCGTRVLEGGLAASDCTTKDCVAILSCDADKNLFGPSSSTCQEDGSWTNETKCFYMEDCFSQYYYELPHGIYLIDTTHMLLNVYCEYGLTVIQRRTTGTVNFDRPWDDYKNGFGALDGEMWLGNEIIYNLTRDSLRQLVIDIVEEDGTKHRISYSTFDISDEFNNYTLTMSGFQSSTALDDFSVQYGSQFSTSDRDNDVAAADCAAVSGGGWWYNGDCNPVDLNGTPYPGGIQWFTITSVPSKIVHTSIYLQYIFE
ncbi:hypothetical protein ScPMuIL_014474 [Solemya velum]